jgi:hypothetical protein
MPRGSNPTWSNRALTAPVNVSDCFTDSTPEPPGPPGSMRIDPMRLAWSFAGRRASPMWIFSPFGFAQSSGTSMDAQSTPSASGQGCQSIAGAAAAAPGVSTTPAATSVPATNASRLRLCVMCYPPMA